jgi:hypothetical protein
MSVVRRYWMSGIGLLAGLAVIFWVGFGFGQRWGAPQWGPFSEWFACAVTLSAAVVAYRAIQRQIKSASDDVANQIKAASKDAADQIAAQRRNQLRSERVVVATEALVLVHDIYLRRGLWAGPPPFEQPEPESDAESEARGRAANRLEEEREIAVRVLTAKLYLFGMAEEAEAIVDFWQSVESAWGTVDWLAGPGVGERGFRFGQLIERLQHALDR